MGNLSQCALLLLPAVKEKLILVSMDKVKIWSFIIFLSKHSDTAKNGFLHIHSKCLLVSTGMKSKLF